MKQLNSKEINTYTYIYIRVRVILCIFRNVKYPWKENTDCARNVFSNRIIFSLTTINSRYYILRFAEIPDWELNDPKCAENATRELFRRFPNARPIDGKTGARIRPSISKHTILLSVCSRGRSPDDSRADYVRRCSSYPRGAEIHFLGRKIEQFRRRGKSSRSVLTDFFFISSPLSPSSSSTSSRQGREPHRRAIIELPFFFFWSPQI